MDLQSTDFAQLFHNLLNRSLLEDSKRLYDACVTREIRDIEFTRDIHALLWSVCSTCLTHNDDPRDKYVWKSMVIMQSLPEYDAGVALTAIPKDFHIQLLRSFDHGTKDSDAYRAKILHWLYYVQPPLRPSIRAAIGQRLLHLVSHPEKLRRVNISPLLQLVYAIISGVATCDSSSVDVFSNLLNKLLLPLHEPNYMIEWRDQVAVIQPYHEILVQTVARTCQLHAEAVSHDPQRSLLVRFLRQLFNIWPESFNANTPKEILFLHEVEQLLEICTPEEFDAVYPALLDRLEKCLCHDNMLPMQRSLQMFKNPKFLRLVGPYSDDLISRLVPALYRDGEMFWNPTVNKMTYLTLKKFMEMNEAKCLEVSRSLTPAISRRNKKLSVPRPTPALPRVHGTERNPSMSQNSLPPMEPWRPSQGVPPPVTVTGVAPWAMSQSSHLSNNRAQPVRRLATADTPPPTKKSMKETSPGHDDVLVEYMERCRLHGGFETQPGDWLQAQAAPAPTRLPQLRFHDLVFGRDIGEGSFGVVKYARHILKGKTRSEWPEYAVKVVSTSRLQDMGRNGFIAVAREIASLQSLTHPGIARLISAFRYTDGNYLVLEYAAKGDLHSHIIQHGALDSLCARFVLGEICAALNSIHDLGLAFNDLKPENILITEVGHIKLTDFGACRAVSDIGAAILEQGSALIENLRDGDWRIREAADDDVGNRVSLEDMDSRTIDEIEGTPAYLPPEVLEFGSLPGKKADSWALGAVMYFIIVGKPKYYGDKEEVLSAIQTESENRHSVHFATAPIDQTFGERARHLLSLLLEKNPQNRIPVSDAMIHPYITLGEDGDSVEIVASELHAQHPIELPSDNRGQMNVADKEWARRQFSMVWAPMPHDYNIPATALEKDRKTFEGDSIPTEIPELSLETGSLFVSEAKSIPLAKPRMSAIFE